jgi:hypothetical protein
VEKQMKIPLNGLTNLNEQPQQINGGTADYLQLLKDISRALLLTGQKLSRPQGLITITQLPHGIMGMLKLHSNHK